MKRKVGYTWRLRELMAQRHIFAATELVPLLRERGIDLSASQVHRLVSGTRRGCRCRSCPRSATSSPAPRPTR